MNYSCVVVSLFVFCSGVSTILASENIWKLLNFVMSGEGWRRERGAGDLPQCVQPRLPRVRRRRPQAGLRLRGQGGHQVHGDLLPGALRPEALHHRWYWVQLASCTMLCDTWRWMQRTAARTWRRCSSAATTRAASTPACSGTGPSSPSSPSRTSWSRTLSTVWRWGSAIPSVLLRIMHLPSQEVGSQLRGLKIQCSGFDLSDIAVLCPNLKSLIIQKEAPNPGGEFNILRQSKLNV